MRLCVFGCGLVFSGVLISFKLSLRVCWFELVVSCDLYNTFLVEDFLVGLFLLLAGGYLWGLWDAWFVLVGFVGFGVLWFPPC